MELSKIFLIAFGLSLASIIDLPIAPNP